MRIMILATTLEKIDVFITALRVKQGDEDFAARPPIIAAPQSWLDQLYVHFGPDDGEPVVVDQVHGVKVVLQADLDEPCLIDADGKVYRVHPKVGG